MTNTENHLTPAELIAASAKRELASAERALAGHLERLKDSPEPWMLMRVLRVRHTTELARIFAEEGIARVVTVATAWRNLPLEGAGDATTAISTLAMAKAGHSWLYNHETDLIDVMWGRLPVSSQDRESIMSDLITGG